MTRDAREEFVERVKGADPLFVRGDLDAFWPALRQLVEMAPERSDLSKKKSHYLASLAVRSLERGDPASAIAFLDFADRALDPDHLNPFLMGERAAFRRQAETATAKTRPRGDP